VVPPAPPSEATDDRDMGVHAQPERRMDAQECAREELLASSGTDSELSNGGVEVERIVDSTISNGEMILGERLDALDAVLRDAPIKIAPPKREFRKVGRLGGRRPARTDLPTPGSKDQGTTFGEWRDALDAVLRDAPIQNAPPKRQYQRIGRSGKRRSKRSLPPSPVSQASS
jgi:hypothetical protein